MFKKVKENLLVIFLYFPFIVLFLYSQYFFPKKGWMEHFPLFHWSLYSRPASVRGQFYVYVDEKKCELSKCDFVSSGFWEAEGFIQQMGRNYKVDDESFREAKKRLEEQLFQNNKELNYELRYRVINPADFIKVGSTKVDESRGFFKTDFK